MQFWLDADHAKQKSLYRSDNQQLAPLGTNLIGELPPTFKVKPSQSRPGQSSYADTTTGTKYQTVEQAWQVYFKRLLERPSQGLESACSSAHMSRVSDVARVSRGLSTSIDEVQQRPRLRSASGSTVDDMLQSLQGASTAAPEATAAAAGLVTEYGAAAAGRAAAGLVTEYNARAAAHPAAAAGSEQLTAPPSPVTSAVAAGLETEYRPKKLSLQSVPRTSVAVPQFPNAQTVSPRSWQQPQEQPPRW
mmetsp:Transcript_154516/g.296632  ORF Transcript_154516/g.296632 Transcript_154516/m.296632 type:complete len:248 (-) Transcript_154516:71-814(-)